MNRDLMVQALDEQSAPWDLIIVGGGATGLGTAVDAAARGYRTLLLEQRDFAQGTSSRSTKLIHGGVRYLQQGNLKLVRESLRERGLLTRNAPHLVRHLAFIVPNYAWWEGPFYGTGLKIYDRLAGKLGLGPSKHLSRRETLVHLPTIEPKGLRGGTMYYDGQFDDARLAITLAQTAADLGAKLVNYMPVIGLLKTPSRTGRNFAQPASEPREKQFAIQSQRERSGICGVIARDSESGREYELQARVVVNASGIFTDFVRQMDEPLANEIISPSQGAHVVLERSFLPGDSAIMVPKTDDHRVLFAIPWHDRVLIGTTETAGVSPQIEPRPLQEEIQFLLTHAARYLTKDPKSRDVLSAFAGLRPLVKSVGPKPTALVPRDHVILVSRSGLVSVTGGKWTTYRKMAEDTVNRAAQVAGLEKRPCTTAGLQLHGATTLIGRNEVALQNRCSYGSDTPALTALMNESPTYGGLVHPRLPYRVAEVIWAVRNEMARRVEDVLSRRTRALLLDARASIEAAPIVAKWMAAELGRDERWQREELAGYCKLAEGYLL